MSWTGISNHVTGFVLGLMLTLPGPNYTPPEACPAWSFTPGAPDEERNPRTPPARGSGAESGHGRELPRCRVNDALARPADRTLARDRRVRGPRPGEPGERHHGSSAGRDPVGLGHGAARSGCAWSPVVEDRGRGWQGEQRPARCRPASFGVRAVPARRLVARRRAGVRFGGGLRGDAPGRWRLPRYRRLLDAVTG